MIILIMIIIPIIIVIIIVTKFPARIVLCDRVIQHLHKLAKLN